MGFGVLGNYYVLGTQITSLGRELKGEIKELGGSIKELGGSIKEVQNEIQGLQSRQTEWERRYMSLAEKILKDCGKST